MSHPRPAETVSPGAEQPWQWSEATWRRHVQCVRAGQRLAPPWPDNARVAVALSFDCDHETIPLRDGDTSPGRLAQGEYGSRTAAPRILRLLERSAVPATFFVPAVAALLHPAEVRDYVAAGHEIALHGWIHERTSLLDHATERALALRTAATLEKITGTRPVGIRTPSWDFTPATLGIIRELGLRYDSSLMADDDCYELLDHGEPSGVVEIPVEWIRDDAPYFAMQRYAALRPYTPPSAVLDIWAAEFDAAYADGGLFQLTMHPHWIGHRSRLAILAKLLAHIAGYTGVWYTTHARLAEHARTALRTPAEARNPS